MTHCSEVGTPSSVPDVNGDFANNRWSKQQRKKCDWSHQICYEIYNGPANKDSDTSFSKACSRFHLRKMISMEAAERTNEQMEEKWRHSEAKQTMRERLGREPGLVVMEDDSCSRGREFEYWMDVTFFHIDLLQKLYRLFEKTKNKWKRGQGLSIFKKINERQVERNE